MINADQIEKNAVARCKRIMEKITPELSAQGTILILREEEDVDALISVLLSFSAEAKTQGWKEDSDNLVRVATFISIQGCLFQEFQNQTGRGKASC